jgi:fructose-1,6-bisphosphatase
MTEYTIKWFNERGEREFKTRYLATVIATIHDLLTRGHSVKVITVGIKSTTQPKAS